jgi:signal transduction histidine kinase
VTLLTGAKDNVTREVELPGGRVLYANVASIRADDKQVMGRVAFLRDITHLKELDEMKTEFVNTVSHDLRSPLTYMRGYVTMLPMVGELNAKQTEYVNKILGGVDQMTELVVDLLNLARIESDVAQLAEPIKVNDLVNSVARIYRTRALGKGLQFRLELAEHLPVLTGDPALLRQAVTNLVDNGVKYTLKGEVEVRTYVEKSDVIIQVKDTGPGVSQTDQVRLFEKFYRVKRRDSLDIKGSGLGLAIVKSVVERRHGGRVWVESQLGVGSTFFIALPIKSSGEGLRMA